MNAGIHYNFILMSLQMRKSEICSLQSDNYIITLRFYDIISYRNNFVKYFAILLHLAVRTAKENGYAAYR